MHTARTHQPTRLAAMSSTRASIVAAALRGEETTTLVAPAPAARALTTTRTIAHGTARDRDYRRYDSQRSQGSSHSELGRNERRSGDFARTDRQDDNPGRDNCRRDYNRRDDSRLR